MTRPHRPIGVLLRIVAAGALTCLLAACGGTASAHKRTAPHQPTPVATDEAVSPRDFGVLDRPLGSACVSIQGAKITTTSCGEDRASEGRPLQNESAHVVARLPDPAGSGRDALFVVYPSTGLGTCFDIKVALDLKRGRSPLQCSARDATCGTLCALIYAPDPSDERGDVLGGAVSAQATGVRVIFAHGATVELPLTENLRYLGRRVFMTIIGARRPRDVEALRNGQRLALQTFG